MIDPREYFNQEKINEFFNHDNLDNIRSIDLSEEYGFEYAANFDHQQFLIVHKNGIVLFYDTDPNEDTFYPLCPKYNYLQDLWYLELGDQNQFKYNKGSYHPINLYCGGKPISYFSLLHQAFDNDFTELENMLYNKYIKGDIENPYSPQWKRVKDYKDVLVSERGQVIICNFLSKDKNRFKNNEILNAFNSVYYTGNYNEYKQLCKFSSEREEEFISKKVIYQLPIGYRKASYFGKSKLVQYCNEIITRVYSNTDKYNEIIKSQESGKLDGVSIIKRDDFIIAPFSLSFSYLINDTWPEKAKEIIEKRVYNKCAYMKNTNNYKKDFNYYENCY